MAWRIENEDELVFDGVEMGIAPSPTKGVANLQNVNIATETGEAMVSFGRFKQNQAAITNGTLTASVSDGAVLLDAPSTLQAGQWITVSASTIPSVTSSASYLIVGGGGGAGGPTLGEASGGGGAGGMLTGSFTPAVAAYTIAVGGGGGGGLTGVTGSNGGNSYITQASVSFDYLIVGGGGGGGGTASSATSVHAGGGGAGQVSTGTSAQSAGSFSITVGAGGAGGIGGNNGSAGSSSVAFSVTSVGGGGGGKAEAGTGTAGSAGASGGGGGASTTGSSAGAGGAATAGNAGGAGASDGVRDAGGGGGGSGAVGTAGSVGGGVSTGGNGGNGTASSITGASVTYGGGGGGSGIDTGGTGGSGGGGNGATTSGNGGAATANTGSGGGGAGDVGTSTIRTGGAGGSGVVIISFPTASVAGYTHTNGSVTTSGSNTIITWNSSGTFTFATVGVALGGGGGSAPATTAGNGGSGGGGGSDGGAAGTGESGQGNNGGAGNGTGDESGGGGGGKGAAGTAATDGVGGNGGIGAQSSISGTATYYAGGGGGGTTGATTGTGGQGGGGDGVAGDPSSSPQCKGDNGFGGGGGGGSGVGTGGAGGSGVVIISYVTGTMTATGGSITFSGGNTIHTFYSNGTFTVQSIAAAGQYFVSYKNSSNKVKLSAIFDPYGLYPIAHGTSGTATFSTLTTTASGLAKATEKYTSASDTYYRYYILDSNGYVWVYDTQVYATTLAANGVGEAWMLPDPTDYSAEDFTGMAVLNGWLIVINNAELQGKPVVDLGRDFAVLEENGDSMQCVNPFPTHNNPAYVGHQGKLYYGDGNYLGQVYPISSLQNGLSNVQSLSSFTGSSTTGTLTSVVTGSAPLAIGSAGTPGRVPVVFFATETTSVPAALTEGTVYWIQMSASVSRQFAVYEEESGGSSLQVTTVGTSYFNTFYPLGDQEQTDGTNIPLFLFTPQRLNLPVFERIQAMVEVGNILLLGCNSSTLYPWNQVDALPSDIVALPESDVKSMLNVNNMAYVFAGNKGNFYISNGSSASLVYNVSDYCAGVPASASTYIEPVFTWGDSAYIRGRVYFSILDQTSTKAGNCGGVWSFYPTQNMAYGQDTGIALRLENQNSYADYDGVATLIISNEQQNVTSPQYWTAWQDSYSVATSAFGIDQTQSYPTSPAIIETDLIPIGTFISKTTFQHFEFKLTTPLATGDSIALYTRTNSTEAWNLLTDPSTETPIISGEYSTNFENAQWLQLRVILTPTGDATTSFCRFKELRLH